jgi:hypothetical protein
VGDAERVRIDFRRRAQGECVSVIHRRDGVVFELPSFSRKHRVPHDLAHAVTERELRISNGVYGLIAAGHIFPTMTVVGGKLRHDAKARSERVWKAYGSSITGAEVLAGAVHHAVESGRSKDVLDHARRSWGMVEQDPFPWTAVDITRALTALGNLAGQWESVGVDECLEFFWPDALTLPVPPPAVAIQRQPRTGRRR